MKFEDILLALIARAPSSGYDLGRWLATEGLFIRANADQSQIYKTLNKLLQNGYIRFSVEERDNAPDAKVYTVTQEGAAHILRVSESHFVPPLRWQEADFTARLVCLVPLNPPTILPLIEAELAFRREQIRQYRNRDRKPRIETGLVFIDEQFMTEALNGLHEHLAEASDEWVEWLETQHEKWSAYFSNTAPAAASRSFAH